LEREKDFSTEKDSTSRSDSKPSSEALTDHSPDEFRQRRASSEFWASRGNIGEKINLLIGLNLSIINLL